MFKFFWANYKKSSFLFYFNSYSSFKNKKNKKIFITCEDTQKNFYNFKKYDMNLKNSTNSRDIIIQYLFDSKFSIFIVTVKLVFYILTLLYFSIFLLYLLISCSFVAKFFIFLFVSVFFYFIFILLFIFNFLSFFFIYFVLTYYVVIFGLMTLLVLMFSKTKIQVIAPFFFLILIQLFPSFIYLISFIFLKVMISYVHIYVILIDYVLLLMGVKVNRGVIASFTFLSKKINFFFYIFLSQSISSRSNNLLFLHFLKSTFYFLFMFFKFLFYNCVSLTLNNDNRRSFQRSKASANFFNFISINNSQVAKASYLLKYNYLLMQKLKFQNIKWLDNSLACDFVLKKNINLNFLNSQSANFFFVENLDVLQNPETILYWKNFNKNLFTKPMLEVFLMEDMCKNNASSYIRNVNQSLSSCNLQYSNLLFKKSFQYQDIVNFYLQNKNNLVFNNSVFNYNYKNGLSKKWDQSRYLLLLNDSSYTIVKSVYYFNNQDVVKNVRDLNLTFIV